jgi:hypothetical protein
MKRRHFLMASGSVAGTAFAPLARAAKPCPPPQINVAGVNTASAACPVTVPSGSSALAKLAASMAAGSWAAMSPGNQNAVLGVGPTSGSMIHYSNKAAWNPVTKKIEYLGEDHNYGSVRYMQYDLASNQFVLVSNDVGFGSFTQHGYDHTTVNPATGDLYHRMIGNGGVGNTTLTVVKKAVASAATFTQLPTVATNYSQVAIATCWWTGSFAGAGSQGCLVIFNGGDSFGNANDGQIVAYDPLTNNWFMNKHGMAPFFMTNGYTYHNVMAYSSRWNCAVYGGSADQPSKLWRLNSDGSMTPMPNVPAGKEVGIQHGNLNTDPVTGNFLLLSAGQLWELNPSGAGTWTQLTGSRTPPSGVGIPGPSNPQGVISAAITEYGVVAYITQSSPAGGTMFIYKHA